MRRWSAHIGVWCQGLFVVAAPPLGLGPPLGRVAARRALALLGRLAVCGGGRLALGKETQATAVTQVTTATCQKTNKYPISRNREQQANRQACASNYHPPSSTHTPTLSSSCKIGPSLSGTEAVWAYLHCSLTRLSLLRQNIKALCCFCREGARGLMRATFHSLPPPPPQGRQEQWGFNIPMSHTGKSLRGLTGRSGGQRRGESGTVVVQSGSSSTAVFIRLHLTSSVTFLTLCLNSFMFSDQNRLIWIWVWTLPPR